MSLGRLSDDGATVMTPTSLLIPWSRPLETASRLLVEVSICCGPLSIGDKIFSSSRRLLLSRGLLPITSQCAGSRHGSTNLGLLRCDPARDLYNLRRKQSRRGMIIRHGRIMPRIQRLLSVLFRGWIKRRKWVVIALRDIAAAAPVSYS